MTGASPPGWRVAGFVVAGGRSRRMGGDKALLPWGRCLDQTLERCRAEGRV